MIVLEDKGDDHESYKVINYIIDNAAVHECLWIQTG